MQLIDIIKVTCGVRQLRAIQRIDEEDFSGVIRKTTEDLERQGVMVTDSYIARGVLALKQYYALPVFDPLNMHAVSDAIDPFWHAHILHTKQYALFCSEVVNGFMHHDPLDHSVVSEVARIRFLYSYTVGVMNDLFSHVDCEFYPTNQEDSLLVCSHQNNDYHAIDDSDSFILPYISKAQPRHSFV